MNKVKITVSNKDTGYYEIHEYEDAEKDYYRDAECLFKDIRKLNGNHFIYGWCEDIGQDDLLSGLWVKMAESECTIKCENIGEV